MWKVRNQSFEFSQATIRSICIGLYGDFSQIPADLWLILVHAGEYALTLGFCQPQSVGTSKTLGVLGYGQIRSIRISLFRRGYPRVERLCGICGNRQ